MDQALDLVDEDGNPAVWLRLEGEPDRSWQGFKCYRDLDPPRSITAAWREYAEKAGFSSETPPNSFRSRAKKWRWVDRVRAYDNWREKNRQAAKIRAIQRAEKKLVERADEIVDALIEAAVSGKTNKAQVRALVQALDRLGLQVPEGDQPRELHLHKHESEGEDGPDDDSNQRAVVHYPSDSRRRDTEAVESEASDLLEDEEDESAGAGGLLIDVEPADESD